MRARRVMLIILCLAFGLSSSLAGAQSPRMILALGNTGFLNPADIQAATGAEVKQDLERFEPKDFAVIVLANTAYAALPAPVQQGLVQYVNGGGTVLITGGAQSFGSGGYQAVASILPFQIRSASDWRGTPFRPPVPLQPSHPIMAGVSFIPVGALNDLNPRPGATEILQAAGGGSAGRVGGVGGGSYPYPLIAEVAWGAGRVLGIAFDLNEFGGMRDRDLFVRNTIAYLLGASRIQAR
ncbi:MAG: hypothetical protein HY713_05650 [candidate division NC10 bacterium]|nr:hypothetical protein [candidate division NC10 bacterium]